MGITFLSLKFFLQELALDTQKFIQEKIILKENFQCSYCACVSDDMCVCVCVWFCEHGCKCTRIYVKAGGQL